MPPVNNTQVTLFRGGTASNVYGDLTDAELTPYMQHVPALLAETAKVVLDPATQTPMTVRSSELLLPPWTGALGSDQVLDEQTGTTYAVIDVTAPPTTVGAPVDLRLTLRRITAAGT